MNIILLFFQDGGSLIWTLLPFVFIFGILFILSFKYSFFFNTSPYLPPCLPPSLHLFSLSSPLNYVAVGGFADIAVRNGLKNLNLNSTQKLRANTAASVGVPVLTLPKGTCTPNFLPLFLTFSSFSVEYFMS